MNLLNEPLSILAIICKEYCARRRPLCMAAKDKYPVVFRVNSSLPQFNARIAVGTVTVITDFLL